MAATWQDNEILRSEKNNASKMTNEVLRLQQENAALKQQICSGPQVIHVEQAP